MIRLTAAAFATVLATAALASDGPPYAGSYDDVWYGDLPHASFPLEPLATDDVVPNGPPYAGSNDDVWYGDVPHASFAVTPFRPDGSIVAGSQYDDTRYAFPEERPASTEARVAQESLCTCCGS